MIKGADAPIFTARSALRDIPDLRRMFQTGKMDNYLSLNAFCRKKGMPLVTTYNPLKLKETGEGIVIEEFVGCKDKGQKSGDFSDHGIQAQNGTFTLYFNNLC